MDAFDLFDEITAEEEQALNERRQQYQSAKDAELAAMKDSPLKRTTAENRKVFIYKPLPSYQIPQIIPALFDLAECNAIYETAVSDSIKWTSSRHSAFPTTDIAIRHTQLEYLLEYVEDRLMPKLAAFYGFKKGDLGFQDLFLVKYDADGQKGLAMHTDGCLLSFNILISPPDHFEGGGTYFESTDQTIHIGQGDCLFHNAKIMHRGVEISRGQRYILVGFVNTVDIISIRQDPRLV